MNRFLLKTARTSGWVLLVLVGLFIVTGYALGGKYGFDELLGAQTALTIHRVFDIPLVVFFLLHAATTIYFALRRWGVIKNEKRPRTAATGAERSVEG